MREMRNAWQWYAPLADGYAGGDTGPVVLKRCAEKAGPSLTSPIARGTHQVRDYAVPTATVSYPRTSVILTAILLVAERPGDDT
jgi:hypothetical protein